VEVQLLPLLVNDGLKKTLAFFPKAPGTVILILGLLINYQDPLISELSSLD